MKHINKKKSKHNSKKDDTDSKVTESESTIEDSVFTLRNFFKDSPHIIDFPLEDEILLRFLTLESLNINKTIARLERFCYMRGCTSNGLPHYFQTHTTREMKFYLKSGFFIPIPEPENRELIVYIDMKAWDVNELTIDQIYTNMCRDLDLLSENKKAQSMGVSLIVDLGGLNRRQTEILISKSHIKDLIRIWQDGFPLRNSKIIFYRESTLFELIFKVFKFWFRSLSLSRVYHMKQGDFEQLKTLWSDADIILPVELGGQNTSLQICRKEWENKIWYRQTQEKPFANIKIDETLQSKKSKPVIKSYEDIPDDLFDVESVPELKELSNEL